MAATPPIERFMRHVDKSGECWLWTGTTVGSTRRYGSFRSTTNQNDPKVYAHRWIYEQSVGPIPAGHDIDHVKDRGCTSPLCVNPAHLEPVTHAENMRRARLTVCRSGRHDLTSDDAVVWDKLGRRRGCKACQRERGRVRSDATAGAAVSPCSR
ncbi:HNH endonuclease [Gordonia phage YorkOnyx]|uniref:HNH endonuclease n=1 Tax=Gordonia phage YorkOnyx TaxID=2762402 RepID=A0A7G8LM68_9CAUD|nr:HNH endonuclease [Gordonia phage YorkOnyx]QNJ58340.1 HNH endonuclease [Gordonia phage YorkOnyx]